MPGFFIFKKLVLSGLLYFRVVYFIPDAMIRFVICCMIILVSTTGNGQFNDSTYYNLRFSSQGIYNKTTDIRSFTLNNALGFSIRKKYIGLTSSNNWIYGQQNSKLTNNDFNSVLNVDVLKDTRRLYYWALMSFSSSYSLKINYQFQAGGGIGYNVLNKNSAEIVLSNGLLFEASEVVLKDSSKIIYQALRNSLRIKHRWQKGMFSWEGTHFWQPNLSDFNDYIIRSNTTISVRLKKWLSISGGLTFNKITRTNRENLLVNFGITFDHYF